MKCVLLFRCAPIAVLVLLAGSSPGLASVQVSGFTGPYDVSNWTEITEGDSSVDTSGAPSSIELIGSDTGSFASRSVLFTTAAAASGLFEFDWDYSTEDVGVVGPPAQFDPAFYYNGARIQLTDDAGAASQSGSISVPVVAGATIGWEIDAEDDILGRAFLTISNFSAPAPNGDNGQVIPELMSVAVWAGLACIAGLGIRRKMTH